MPQTEDNFRSPCCLVVWKSQRPLRENLLLFIHFHAFILLENVEFACCVTLLCTGVYLYNKIVPFHSSSPTLNDPIFLSSQRRFTVPYFWHENISQAKVIDPKCSPIISFIKCFWTYVKRNNFLVSINVNVSRMTKTTKIKESSWQWRDGTRIASNVQRTGLIWPHQAQQNTDSANKIKIYKTKRLIFYTETYTRLKNVQTIF